LDDCLSTVIDVIDIPAGMCGTAADWRRSQGEKLQQGDRYQ